jgi:signal transduction histidine kinase
MLAALAAIDQTNFASFNDATTAYFAVLMHALDVRSAFISHFDGLAMRILRVRDVEGCQIPAGRVMPLEESFCQYVRARGMPVVIRDATRDTRVQHAAFRTEFNIGSYLGVPLLSSNGTIYGTLCALDPEPRQFRQTHMHFAQIIARHIVILMEHEQVMAADRDAIQDLSPALGALDAQALVLQTTAHDIRSPLSSIQGYVEMLQSEFYGSLSEDQLDMLAQIRASAQFIHRLTVDLSDAGAAESGALTVLPQQFVPQQLMQSILEACRPQANTRNITLKLCCDKSIPAMVSDPDRLRQIVLNFMSNALRYTSNGEIMLRLAWAGELVQISVEDSGAGIPSSVQQAIWHRYTRNSAATNGHGLGLYIVQRLAHAIGATVGLESTPGQGSTFWVRLPVEGMPQATTWGDLE